jgi:hypothetical protein
MNSETSAKVALPAPLVETPTTPTGMVPVYGPTSALNAVDTGASTAMSSAAGSGASTVMTNPANSALWASAVDGGSINVVNAYGKVSCV